ncbi:hypothetical protein NQ317_015836 [Molorchus minor]|uniref:Uncharacterized protein n=1 Tax=Molorchus minor TaxID=1323400 RepID=A0ABQ9JNE1_9CUCU|nr:hypothetical protein NQ317_015836 [Molorchus minor]
MNSLLYWILFSVLVSLLVIFISCIVFNIIFDNCLTSPEDRSKMYSGKSEDENRRLSKYQFERNDVEDLTRIQGDFKTILPKLTITNEVSTAGVDRLLKRKEIKPEDATVSSLSDINEEEASKSIDDVCSESVRSTTSAYSITTEDIEHDFKISKGVSRSVDDLEFCDPRAIDFLKDIERIKEDTRNAEREVDYFVGNTNSVKFYEINEKFLKLMITLSNIVCDTEELRRKKSETLEFIESCQRKLKEKVKENF